MADSLSLDAAADGWLRDELEFGEHKLLLDRLIRTVDDEEEEEEEEAGEDVAADGDDALLHSTMLYHEGEDDGDGAFDHTGVFYVWPAAQAYCRLLGEGQLVDAVSGKHVIELGSGTGLAGLLTSRFAASVLLSDADEHAVRVLKHNAQLEQLRRGEDGEGASLATVRFDWAEGAEALLAAAVAPPDVILCCDLIYPFKSVETLMKLWGQLLAAAPDAVILVAGSEREVDGENQFLEQLSDELGSSVVAKRIDGSVEKDPVAGRSMRVYLYQLTLRKSGEEVESEEAERKEAE
eukprot:PLAT12631.1.p2 GENE.PLAT12631.1~~PLAT12631.1.p2  ORF type:complete len:303 (-),score=157.83 PLAT12631.1:198-1076(-)